MPNFIVRKSALKPTVSREDTREFARAAMEGLSKIPTVEDDTIEQWVREQREAQALTQRPASPLQPETQLEPQSDPEPQPESEPEPESEPDPPAPLTARRTMTKRPAEQALDDSSMHPTKKRRIAAAVTTTITTITTTVKTYPDGETVTDTDTKTRTVTKPGPKSQPQPEEIANE